MTPDEIKALRASRGWTQTELAEQLGVTLRSVQHWEAGERNPRGVVVKLFDLLAEREFKKKTKKR